MTNSEQQFIEDQSQAELGSISGKPRNIEIAALRTIYRKVTTVEMKDKYQMHLNKL